MSEKNKITVTDEDLKQAFTGESTDKKPLKKASEKEKGFSKKKFLSFLITGIVTFVAGVSLIVTSFLLPSASSGALSFPQLPSETAEEGTYSLLTGEKIADEALKTAPTYCIQMPNGTDGGRPQSGLSQAGVIFEAIAEAGITRFAAIYQNPSTAIIGPVRSLRIYYLDWDTPFDCTIVHAGGAVDALDAVAAGGYKDLVEDPKYLYRSNNSSRNWNNLFTTSNNLQEFSKAKGYDNSNLKGFARLTPTESEEMRVKGLTSKVLDITSPSDGDTSEVKAEASNIKISFGGIATFNVNYDYDPETNTYLRSYANGTKHDVYVCPEENLGEKNPEDVCELKQLAPAVVIAMVVQESKSADTYHEAITTIGSGKVHIFQNGTVINGTWSKTSKNDQIKFLDENGSEIKLAPGQTFISAVPTYGSVEY